MCLELVLSQMVLRSRMISSILMMREVFMFLKGFPILKLIM